VIVLDASVVVAALLRLPTTAAVETLLFSPGESLHAPHLIDIEVTHALRTYTARGQVDSERGRIMLQYLVDLPLIRYPHERLLPRVWELRNNLTAYDAVYVALAEVLDAPLLTRDRRLAAAPGIRARIEVV